MEELKPVFKVKFECQNCGHSFQKKYTTNTIVSPICGDKIAIFMKGNIEGTNVVICDVCGIDKIKVIKRHPLKKAR